MKMPFTLDAPAPELAVLAESGAAVTSKDDLLKEYKAGTRHAVTFSATTYIHGPNRNHTRLNDAELEKFAESFKGQPFLQDHARNQSGRGGTILDSRLLDENGKKSIRMTVKAVKPWAVEGVLDETVDRFSIGWNANQYECTADGKPFFKCGHGLDDLGEVDEKSGKTVEVLMKGLEGMEVSAVTHPAVPGTGVLDALRQLQQNATSQGAHNPQEDPVKEKVFSLLGLSADTSEPDALIALEKRLTAPVEKVPAAMLSALELKSDASANEAIAAVVSLKAPGNYVPKSEHDKLIEALGALSAEKKVDEAKRAGKITPAMEAWALGFAKSDPNSFDAFINHAPVQIPRPQTPAITPGTPAATESGQMSELASHVAERMGVTPEEYAATVKAERAN